MYLPVNNIRTRDAFGRFSFIAATLRWDGGWGKPVTAAAGLFTRRLGNTTITWSTLREEEVNMYIKGGFILRFRRKRSARKKELEPLHKGTATFAEIFRQKLASLSNFFECFPQSEN